MRVGEMMTLRSLLLDLRRRSGLTQAQLAAAIAELGSPTTAQTTVSAAETWANAISPELVTHWLNATDATEAERASAGLLLLRQHIDRPVHLAAAAAARASGLAEPREVA